MRKGVGGSLNLYAYILSRGPQLVALGQNIDKLRHR